MLGDEHNAEGVSFWMKFLYFLTKSRLKQLELSTWVMSHYKGRIVTCFVITFNLRYCAIISGVSIPH